jgi:hypothetical protein
VDGEVIWYKPPNLANDDAADPDAHVVILYVMSTDAFHNDLPPTKDFILAGTDAKLALIFGEGARNVKLIPFVLFEEANAQKIPGHPSQDTGKSIAWMLTSGELKPFYRKAWRLLEGFRKCNGDGQCQCLLTTTDDGSGGYQKECITCAGVRTPLKIVCALDMASGEPPPPPPNNQLSAQTDSHNAEGGGGRLYQRL